LVAASDTVPVKTALPCANAAKPITDTAVHAARQAAAKDRFFTEAPLVRPKME